MDSVEELEPPREMDNSLCGLGRAKSTPCLCMHSSHRVITTQIVHRDLGSLTIGRDLVNRMVSESNVEAIGDSGRGQVIDRRGWVRWVIFLLRKSVGIWQEPRGVIVPSSGSMRHRDPVQFRRLRLRSVVVVHRWD